ncbi:MAG: hypothetical protein NTU70_02515 [Methylococcales bacterium]|nr:hypothetical protein [Methylococcales bacterium]
MVESSLEPRVIGNSIIAVLLGEDIKTGDAGMVDYVESEYIVRIRPSA